MATKKTPNKKPEAVETSIPEKKPKRVLRAAPTLREQTSQSADTAKTTKADKASQIVTAPFRIIGKAIWSLALVIARSPLGKLVAFIWGSALFIPVRFIVRILAKVLFISYFVKSFQELKLVTWPNANTTARLTFAVIMFAVIFGLIVAGMDFVFEKLFREVIL